VIEQLNKLERLSVDTDTGRPIRKIMYVQRKQDALDRLNELRSRKKLSAAAVTGKDSVAAYLERWLADEVKLNRAPKTYQDYEMALRLYVTPFIGHHHLNKLTGEMLVHWQGTLSRKKFSAYQRKRAIRVLRNALNRAVKLQRIPVNPCVVLTMPKRASKEVQPLEPIECHSLFVECEKHRIGDAIVLAAMTGLRKGELFALDWSAVNLSEGVLVVRRTLQELGTLTLKAPKSKAGKRVVTLGTDAVAALRRRLKKANEESE
jgi:integrase